MAKCLETEKGFTTFLKEHSAFNAIKNNIQINKDMKIRNNDLSYKSIDIDIADGVSIHLYKCEYDELIKLLLPDMEQEIKNAYSLHQRAMEQRQQCWEMVKEIRELFYECSDEEFCIRKSLDEIEESKLVEVLEKYHKLLGFV